MAGRLGEQRSRLPKRWRGGRVTGGGKGENDAGPQASEDSGSSGNHVCTEATFATQVTFAV